jgi:hypothetical protein
MRRSNRVTRWVCEKNRTKYSPTHLCSKLVHSFCWGKRIPDIVVTYLCFQKTSHSVQSPNRPKIAKSGHPVGKTLSRGVSGLGLLLNMIQSPRPKSQKIGQISTGQKISPSGLNGWNFLVDLCSKSLKILLNFQAQKFKSLNPNY